MRSIITTYIMFGIFVFGTNTMQAQDKREIGKSVLLTLGNSDPLPTDSEVVFQVRASRTRLNKPVPGIPALADAKTLGISHSDLIKEDFAPEVLTISKQVDKSGHFTSNVSTFNFLTPMPKDKTKLNIIQLEVDATIQLNGQILFHQVTEFPVVLKATDTDLIPVCISTTYRNDSEGKMVFGLARHSCESPLDLSKAKAVRKN